jgi:hypothetical protein
MLEALFRLQRYKIKCIYARVEAKKMYFYFNIWIYIRFYGAPTNFVSEWGERRHKSPQCCAQHSLRSCC